MMVMIKGVTIGMLDMSCSNSIVSYIIIKTANMMILENSKTYPLGRLQWGKYINHLRPIQLKQRTRIQSALNPRCCSMSISITLTIQDGPKHQLIVPLSRVSHCIYIYTYTLDDICQHVMFLLAIFCSLQWWKLSKSPWTFDIFNCCNSVDLPLPEGQSWTMSCYVSFPTSILHQTFPETHLRTDTSTNSSWPNGTKWHCSFVDPVANAKRSSEATTARSMAKAYWRCEGQHSS